MASGLFVQNVQKLGYSSTAQHYNWAKYNCVSDKYLEGKQNALFSLAVLLKHIGLVVGRSGHIFTDTHN